MKDGCTKDVTVNDACRESSKTMQRQQAASSGTSKPGPKSLHQMHSAIDCAMLSPNNGSSVYMQHTPLFTTLSLLCTNLLLHN